MNVGAFIQPLADGLIITPYTDGALNGKGQAQVYARNTVGLIYGAGYYLVVSQTPLAPTSTSGTITLSNWSRASKCNVAFDTHVPASQFLEQPQFSTTAGKAPDDGGNTRLIFLDTPPPTFNGIGVSPYPRQPVYVAQVVLAAFTAPAVNATVAVAITSTQLRRTWQYQSGNESPIVSPTVNGYVRTSGGLYQITAIGSGTLTIKNLGADWNRAPGYAVKAGGLWQTDAATTSFFYNVVSSDANLIFWNGGGQNLYLPWGFNPDLVLGA